MKSLVPSFWLLITICSILPLSAQRKATILDHKDRIQVSRLSILNSKARETNLSITPDGNYLFFMSLRGEQVWSRPYMIFEGDSVYDGDIWYSRKINGKWGKPKCLPYGINSAMGEDEPNISANGSSLYFQSWNINWEYTGGPYYKTKRQDQDWGRPKGLGGGITEFFSRVQATDGMTLSPDERMFFVAAGNEYDEPMDIFISKLTGMGWTFCRRLPISTEGDERSVFIAADNKTVYFASDSYDGFGGLDIYKTTLNADGTTGEVINIGEPFNTPGDDYGFILTADGLEAYFVRNGDIYFADLEEADERIRPEENEFMNRLRGGVRDSASWKGLTADVMLLDARTQRLVRKTRTSRNGRFSLDIPNSDQVYDLVVSTEGYKGKRQRINTDEALSEKTYTVNFFLTEEETEAAPPPIARADPEPTPTPAAVPLPPSPSMKAMPTVKEKAEPDGPDSGTSSAPSLPPAMAPIPMVEDPYSFEGVAENNLTLLLDVSASMRRPEKLPLLKDALLRMLSFMRPEDRLTIVTYSGDVKVVVDGVSAARKEEIAAAIENLGIAGSTNGKGALRKAHRLAKDNFIAGGNNRIIMATDGFFEVKSLYASAERISRDGINLTIFSFGKQAPSRIEELEEAARRGGGNHTNITRENADKALLQEAKAVGN